MAWRSFPSEQPAGSALPAGWQKGGRGRARVDAARGPAWLSRARSGAGRAGRADPQGYADRRRAAAAGVHAHLGVGAGGGAAAERPHRPSRPSTGVGDGKVKGMATHWRSPAFSQDGHDAAVGLVDAAGGGAHDGDVLPGGGEAGDAALLSRRAAGGTLVVGAVPDQLLVADLEASRQAGDAGAGRLLASVAADSAVEERGPLQKRAGRRADGDVAMGIAGVALIAVGRARGELQSERDRSRRAFAAAAGPAAAARPAAATGPPRRPSPRCRRCPQRSRRTPCRSRRFRNRAR
jgi:hypothetical protein